MQFTRYAIGIVLLFVMIFITCSMYAMNAHAVNPATLDRLALGMTTVETETILGEPQTITLTSDGSTQWSYHGTTWCMVNLEFAPDGRLASIEHDH